MLFNKIKSKNQKILTGFFIGFCISLFFGVIIFLNFFYSWNEKLNDLLFIPKKPNPLIAILAIDDSSIQSIGQWPWKRSVHAEIISKLEENGAVVIAYDVAFSEPSTETEDLALEKAISSLNIPIVLSSEGQRIVVNENIIVAAGFTKPLDRFVKDDNYGLVNLITSKDGVTRFFPFQQIADENIKINNFSVQVLKKFNGYKRSSVKTTKKILRINYFGPEETFPMYSVKDLLNNGVGIKEIKDKIVLVGATAENLHDNALTPVSGKPISGIEIHANILNTLLDNDFLVDESKIKSFFTLAFITIASSVLFINLSIKKVVFLGVSSAFIFLIYCFISFDNGVVRPILFTVLSIILTIVVNIAYKYQFELKQKRFIRGAFSYYLSKAVMDELLANPEKLRLGGERKKITVLFTDIAGFTSISEKLEPEKLSELLNIYLTKMTNIVFKHHGVLDKYIGDAVMAFWGAPLIDEQQAIRACLTALEMQEATKDMSSEWKKYGINSFKIRIGINTEEMIVGNMGSNQRFDYTLLGDGVNLGARLESINKFYGTDNIISKYTYKAVKNEVVTRKLDTVTVKGKTKGVEIYELRPFGNITDDENVFLEEFEKARMLYEKGEFSESLKFFNKLEKKYPKDKTIKIYIERLSNIIKNPPKKWSGVFVAQSK